MRRCPQIREDFKELSQYLDVFGLEAIEALERANEFRVEAGAPMKQKDICVQNCRFSYTRLQQRIVR